MGVFYSCPEQETVAIIETCGKFSHIAMPGCNCVHCYMGQSVAGKLSLRVQQLDVTCETKTKDNVFVTLVISVQYQVRKESVYDAFYRLTDSRQQISSYVFDVVRATVPKLNLDDVFLEKEEIARNIKDELTKSMGSFGFVIIQALVNDIDPAAKVKEAMNEINAAQRLRLAAVEKAEAQKVSVVKAAEADAEAKYLGGLGIARQRQAIMNGLRESVKEFSTDVNGVTSRDAVELMLITQYFDMLKDVGAHNKSSTLFIPHGPGNIADISSQMRTAFLQAGAAQKMER